MILKTKIIAIYFPQFHQTPENDEWWGEGFSDWNLVKSAKPLFIDHYQPRIPVDGYYNPCDVNVLKRQASLAKDYGIHGFMFYHYWFDGKLMLEKPLETLLKHSEIDIPFCVCWANNSWTRQWLGNNEILLEQKHLADQSIWEKHFNYLLPFFSDERYIKLNGKPVFSIYSPDLLNKTKELFEYWNSLSIKHGFSGIHFMAVKNYDYPAPNFLSHYNSLMKFQPRESNTSFKNTNRQKMSSSRLFRMLPEKLRFFLGDLRRKLSGYTIISSKNIWDYILQNACVNDYPQYAHLSIFESVYFMWDNTARYRSKATIFTELNKNEKIYYFSKLYDICNRNNCEFLFFNAWNEWSESAYLEPDEKFGYENLCIIRNTLLKE